MAKIKVKTLTDNKGENFYPLTHGTAVVNDQGVNMEDRMTHVEDTVEQKSKEQAEFFEATEARVSETEGQVAQFEGSVTQEVADLKRAQNEFYATTNTRVQSFEDDVEARLAEKAKIGVVDETGDSNEYVMSQAAVTRELAELESEVGGIHNGTSKGIAIQNNASAVWGGDNIGRIETIEGFSCATVALPINSTKLIVRNVTPKYIFIYSQFFKNLTLMYMSIFVIISNYY
ncbi:MAG: hypothetical protein IIW42_01930 [Bacteroidaceae bacterium]|nr:hypothetical protein [Bacteroidaceae bacterium]